jgi:hypothetical protein
MLSGERPDALAAYRQYRVNRKAEDALLLVEELKRAPSARGESRAWIASSSLFDARVLPALAEEAAAAYALDRAPLIQS